MREIINGIFYVMRAGCPWRLLPNDLPPWGTVYRWFAAWRDDGELVVHTKARHHVGSG
jgi:transposase